MNNISNIQIESWKTGDLIPYELNNKKHPSEHIEQLAASIKEFGFEHPICVEEDGVIISGHGRLLAAQLIGLTHVPVRVLRGLSKSEASKLRIAANKTTSNDYDTDALSAELAKLEEDGLELTGMGFSDRELTMLMDDVGEVDLGVMTTDIGGEVEKHDEELKDEAASVGKVTVNISEAFGIKKITLDQKRVLSRFMGFVEGKTGKLGVDALIEYAEDAAA